MSLLMNIVCTTCGNNDLPVALIHTAAGNFYRCPICARLGAGVPNDPRFIKNTVYYDKYDDMYYKHNDVVILKSFISGDTTKYYTREALVKCVYVS